MYKKIDIQNWSRKAHFEFFKEFSQPFFGITAPLDCTELKSATKKSGVSLYLSYLHKSLLAANRIEEFRLRLTGDEVILFNEVSASPTVLRPDNTFGFGYFPFRENFENFAELAQKELARVAARTDLEPAIKGEAVIHYTAIPWLSFTQIKHPSHDGFKNSIPKISFGKIYNSNGREMLPVSVEVHHALMDGYHVGKYFELLQELFDSRTCE